MYSIELGEPLVVGTKLVNSTYLYPHEEVVESRLSALTNYLLSLKPYAIIPSILTCNQTNVIIDGHHRFYALRALGFSDIPVTQLNYTNPKIIPDLDGKLDKSTVLSVATTGSYLPPKTSFHHVLDRYNKPQPLILLSVLCKLDFDT